MIAAKMRFLSNACVFCVAVICLVFFIAKNGGGQTKVVVKKILNNNVITSNDEDGQEIIIVGTGIGWKQKPGQPVETDKIEKIFRMDTASSTARLKQLFLEVQMESIRVSAKIVDYARAHLDNDLKKNIYITLTDHIDFAIDRFRRGLNFRSVLYWELRTVYPKEFEVGMYALKIIEECMGVALPEHEATSIALHLINAEYDGNMSHAEATVDIVHFALDVVRLLLGKDFDEDSLDYRRFVTHLLFFAQRVMEHKPLDQQGGFLYQTMCRTYPREVKCAEKIARYVESNYQVDIGTEEITFLTVHIVRVAGTDGNR